MRAERGGGAWRTRRRGESVRTRKGKMGENEEERMALVEGGRGMGLKAAERKGEGGGGRRHGKGTPSGCLSRRRKLTLVEKLRDNLHLFSVPQNNIPLRKMGWRLASGCGRQQDIWLRDANCRRRRNKEKEQS